MKKLILSVLALVLVSSCGLFSTGNKGVWQGAGTDAAVTYCSQHSECGTNKYCNNGVCAQCTNQILACVVDNEIVDDEDSLPTPIPSDEGGNNAQVVSIYMYNAGKINGNVGGNVRTVLNDRCSAYKAPICASNASHYLALIGVNASDSFQSLAVNHSVPTDKKIVVATNTSKIIASDWANLVQPNLTNSLSTAGIVPGPYYKYWTGYDADNNCNNWTTSSEFVYGSVGKGNAGTSSSYIWWLEDNYGYNCMASFYLLCICW